MRKAVRAEVYAALNLILTAVPRLSNARVVSAWRPALDVKSLPAIGIATPSERFEPTDQSTTQGRVALVIVLKRTGDDDLEDQLDDDAEALIDPLIDALIREDRGVELSSSAIDISADGSPRIGTLTLTFDIIHWRDRAQV